MGKDDMYKISIPCVFILSVCTFGCGEPGSPSKEAAIQTLNDFWAAIEKHDYPSAAKYFIWPEGTTEKAKRDKLKRMMDNVDVSKKGIEILASRGTWGKMNTVFDPKRAKGMASRHNVDLDACYGLKLTWAEAAFYSDGNRMMLLYVDDFGQLEMLQN